VQCATLGEQLPDPRTCPVRGPELERKAHSGAPAAYCEVSCKQAAYRIRAAGLPVNLSLLVKLTP
jgi:hypothetical protein